jgi:succinate-semialdehyde dehydrogenase / glutarate-semialdehyde dehydrogenase
MLNLRDPLLLRTSAFVNGAWIDGSENERIEVRNPATGVAFASVASVGPIDVERAIAGAETAWQSWKYELASTRADALYRWYGLVVAHWDDLALILTSEQGKPIHEARSEIEYGADYIRWFSEEARRINGWIPPGQRDGARLSVMKQPVGVVAAITPWNFPNAMITRKVAPALAAGCTVVLKPASATPLSALALAELAVRAGIPPGVFSVLPSRRSSEVGAVLATSPKVRKLTFTGSTEIGRELLSKAATTVKKCSMELGGNAPAIVFDRADIDTAVGGVLNAKFRNAGQTCVCANRIYVQSAVYDEFAARLATAVSQLKVGDGQSSSVQMGPLIDASSRQRVEQLITEACSAGARVLVGGGRADDDAGNYLAPTVLVDVSQSMLITRTEIFGPVAPLIRFDTEAEAVAMANDSIHGLAAYVFDSDADRLVRVAEALEVGMVGVNTGLISTEVAPFGGVKQSGLGREGGMTGIEDYQELKYVCTQLRIT